MTGINEKTQVRKKKSCVLVVFALGQINFWLGKYICHIYIFLLAFHATNFHKNKNFTHVTGQTEIYTQ